MHTVVLAGLLLASPPVAEYRSVTQGDACRPTAPEHPTNSEEFNPGLGGSLGLNDDKEDVHPFGRLLSEYYIKDLAQNGEPGSASYVSYQTGNDCARAEEDDE